MKKFKLWLAAGSVIGKVLEALTDEDTPDEITPGEVYEIANVAVRAFDLPVDLSEIPVTFMDDGSCIITVPEPKYGSTPLCPI